MLLINITICIRRDKRNGVGYFVFFFRQTNVDTHRVCYVCVFFRYFKIDEYMSFLYILKLSNEKNIYL